MPAPPSGWWSTPSSCTPAKEIWSAKSFTKIPHTSMLLFTLKIKKRLEKLTKYSEPLVKFLSLCDYQKKEQRHPSMGLKNCSSTLTSCSRSRDFCLGVTRAVVVVEEDAEAEEVEDLVVEEVDAAVAVGLGVEEEADLVEEVVDLVEEVVDLEVVVDLEEEEEEEVDLVEEAVLAEVVEGSPEAKCYCVCRDAGINTKKCNKQFKLFDVFYFTSREFELD